jgi:cell filamentation protein
MYEWAGQIRTVAIAKGAMFCLPQYIDSAAAIIFRELHDEDCLRGLLRAAFAGRLACYLGEVNALHPFRDGNGRTQRAFFGQLACSTGFTLAWQHLDAARNVEASAAIMRGDPEPMRKMLDALVRDGT